MTLQHLLLVPLPSPPVAVSEQPGYPGRRHVRRVAREACAVGLWVEKNPIPPPINHRVLDCCPYCRRTLPHRPIPHSLIPRPHTLIPRPHSLIPSHIASYPDHTASYPDHSLITRPHSLIPRPHSLIPRPHSLIPRPHSLIPRPH